MCREKVWGAFIPDLEAARENAFAVALAKLESDIEAFMKKQNESNRPRRRQTHSNDVEVIEEG